MKQNLRVSFLVSLLLSAAFGSSAATTRYVNPNNSSPASPYSAWDSAAANIQDAVDVAVAGDQILVTNGVYRTGGRVVVGLMTNRVVVAKAVTVQSVNGPGVTAIEGYQVPGTTNGDGAIRGVYLTNGAVLVGFTVTNGATRALGGGGDTVKECSGGGIWCASASAVVSNCVMTGNSASVGGGAHSGTLNNCMLTGNWSSSAGGGADSATLNNCTLGGDSGIQGGGAYGCTLNNCTLTGNSAGTGGGAYSSTLTNCTLTGNSAGNGGGSHNSTLNNCTLANNLASQDGGGATYSTLNNCTLSGNSANAGGGAYYAALNNCVLATNSARGSGGGVYCGVLNNCLVAANASQTGGGAYAATNINCTFAANSASAQGGGVSGGTNKNCILYYNSAPTGSNYVSSRFNYCCTAPLPTSGLANFTNPPMFVDWVNGNFRLQPGSPCVNAGLNAYVSTPTDLDGNARIAGGTVDVGAYEYQTQATVPFYVWLQQYGLPADGSADYADADHDGLNNWQEWMAGTNPTNAASVLCMVSVTNSTSGAIVSWASVANRSYSLERALNLGGPPPAFSVLQGNIPGLDGVTSFTDTNASGAGPCFYRVRLGQ
jgi:hypothetical protein